MSVGGRPKILAALRHYNRRTAIADLTAGVTVGLVALPLALAFAISSGLAPQAGIYTAVVAGGLISLLGGSQLQIGGPTGAFVVIVAGIVQRYGLDGLRVATLMAGVILILIGIARFGSAIKFIPFPVVVGFTSGVALIIFSSQIKDFLGLPLGALPADCLHQWAVYAQHLADVNPSALAVSLGSLAVMLGWQRVSRRMPGSSSTPLST